MPPLLNGLAHLLSFYVSFGDLNSDPHAGTAMTVFTEPLAWGKVSLNFDFLTLGVTLCMIRGMD